MPFFGRDFSRFTYRILPRQNERSTTLSEHRIIDGRLMKVVHLEAADVRSNEQHIMNEPPISGNEQKAVRASVDGE